MRIELSDYVFFITQNRSIGKLFLLMRSMFFQYYIAPILNSRIYPTLNVWNNKNFHTKVPDIVNLWKLFIITSILTNLLRQAF